MRYIGSGFAISSDVSIKAVFLLRTCCDPLGQEVILFYKYFFGSILCAKRMENAKRFLFYFSTLNVSTTKKYR